MGPSASAELACSGVDRRPPLLTVPAPPSAKTCVLGTKGIIQCLEAEHWHLCFIDYLKLEIFKGQLPPQPLCSLCWHPLGRIATTEMVFLKPGDPQAPRTDTITVCRKILSHVHLRPHLPCNIFTVSTLTTLRQCLKATTFSTKTS